MSWKKMMENSKTKVENGQQRTTYFVMSGKGGVGKTTIAVNLASLLACNGNKTGLLDIDIHGPNAAHMLGCAQGILENSGGKIFPVHADENLLVVSVAFMTDDDAIIWRGPMKHKLIQQFSEDVNWDGCQYLVIDFPPGTGDEQISAAQLFGSNAHALIVTSPQEVSLQDAVRTIDFCRKLRINIAGIIENMSGDVFGSGNAQRIAVKYNVPFLGNLDMDAHITESANKGKPFATDGSNAAAQFLIIRDALKNINEKKERT